MRSWHPIPPLCLDKDHLLGEHNELHTMWNVITQCKKGYYFHTETQRWVIHLPALAARHDLIVAEMLRRGYNHQSPLSDVDQYGQGVLRWPRTIDPVDYMRRLLAAKQQKNLS